jgi:hypothetical protein
MASSNPEIAAADAVPEVDDEASDDRAEKADDQTPQAEASGKKNRDEAERNLKAAEVLPWWYQLLQPEGVTRADANPIFWAIVRHAASQRSTPARLIKRNDPWFQRSGGFLRLLRESQGALVSANDVVQGTVAAGTIPRRLMRAHYPSRVSELVVRDFMVPLVGLTLLGVLAWGFLRVELPSAARDLAAEQVTTATKPFILTLVPNVMALAAVLLSCSILTAFLLLESMAWFTLRGLFQLLQPRYGNWTYIY